YCKNRIDAHLPSDCDDRFGSNYRIVIRLIVAAPFTTCLIWCILPGHRLGYRYETIPGGIGDGSQEIENFNGGSNNG
ncbi:MAG: hypothetical protein PHH86_02130, partial [Sphaerochaetaceae bacterium]|nr:hypothetical protein [Sphaerochaetaceae bacterium]